MFFVQELTALGFRPQDILLITWVPIFATIGGVVGVFLSSSDYSKVPEDAQKIKSFDHATDIIAWVMFRLFIALVAGITVAFLMVNSLEVAAASVAKMFVLAIFCGLSAPSLFLAQQKTSIKKLTSIFGLNHE